MSATLLGFRFIRQFFIGTEKKRKLKVHREKSYRSHKEREQTFTARAEHELDQLHREKTRVPMPAKMFPHLKLLCCLFMGPALGFDTKQ